MDEILNLQLEGENEIFQSILILLIQNNARLKVLSDVIIEKKDIDREEFKKLLADETNKTIKNAFSAGKL